MTKLIMLKVCATIATINTVEQKNHGTAPTRNFTQGGCAKTVTSTCTTRKNGNNTSLLIKNKTSQTREKKT